MTSRSGVFGTDGVVTSPGTLGVGVVFTIVVGAVPVGVDGWVGWDGCGSVTGAGFTTGVGRGPARQPGGGPPPRGGPGPPHP
ncbi:hypothetical protein, partial [Nocardia abscessus]|uniref:hypothetical protein n=1 Tax=Nocardia abscessus TaxID=120957 RepID=UPI0024570306